MVDVLSNPRDACCFLSGACLMGRMRVNMAFASKASGRFLVSPLEKGLRQARASPHRRNAAGRGRQVAEARQWGRKDLVPIRHLVVDKSWFLGLKATLYDLMASCFYSIGVWLEFHGTEGYSCTCPHGAAGPRSILYGLGAKRLFSGIHCTWPSNVGTFAWLP